MLRIPCKVLKWTIRNFWNGNKLALRKLRQFYPYLRAVLIKILKTFWTITAVLFGCLFDLKKHIYIWQKVRRMFLLQNYIQMCALSWAQLVPCLQLCKCYPRNYHTIVERSFFLLFLKFVTASEYHNYQGAKC